MLLLFASGHVIFLMVFVALFFSLSLLISGSFGTTSALAQSPLLSLLGGFLIVGGSRLADGCTSGHGISGMSSLALTSFVAVPAMFAAGIATSFLRSVLF
jgi:uncharacterized membrane protein YedE/YeeE